MDFNLGLLVFFPHINVYSYIDVESTRHTYIIEDPLSGQSVPRE